MYRHRNIGPVLLATDLINYKQLLGLPAVEEGRDNVGDQQVNLGLSLLLKVLVVIQPGHRT